MQTLFAVCAPGLEPFLRSEMRQLSLIASVDEQAKDETLDTPVEEEGGGILFEGERQAIYQANLHLSTASRVLVRLGEFYAAAFSELRKKAGRLPWEKYLTAGQPVALRVTCHKSRLYHSAAVAERIAGAICDRLDRPSPLVKFDDKADPPLPQLVVVRLVRDLCTISLDTSGALLHRRGYRLATAKAPLRETLAAGILLASGWEGAAPLLDPFCGSGTIPIEAARLARRIAPGGQRRFAFMDWPDFDARLWESLLAESRAKVRPLSVPIQASDRDAGAIEMAQANAERAGVAGQIEFTCRALSSVEPPGVPGWLVTNPPYGQRVHSSKDLRNLYAQLGKVLRLKCPGWRVGILCNDEVLLSQAGLPLDTRLELLNGGIPVHLGRGSVPRL